MDFVSLLNNFASADNTTRKMAEDTLSNIRDNDFPTFVTKMLEVLVTSSNNTTIRHLAGTLFKRALSGLSGQTLSEKQSSWSGMDTNLRANIKTSLLQCLNDNSIPVRNAAASAISAIAFIEIPMGFWKDIFDTLSNIIQDPNNVVETKIAGIETIRYICEDLEDYPLPAEMTSTIFMAILYCLQSNQPLELWNEAIQALDCAISFSSDFMKGAEQCQCIMQSILNTLQCESSEVQSHAFQCLTHVFIDAYNYIQPYYPTFYQVCQQAISGNDAELSIQASFTLTTLADIEYERSSVNEQIFNLCNQSYTDLMPILCETMAKQSDEDDGETMTPSLAAASCLSSFANLICLPLIELVWPFVNSNITNPNWHYKDAAIMVFGCILTGQNEQYMTSIIAQGCPLLIDNVLHEQCIAVRESSAWVLLQICKSYLSSVPAELTTVLIECFITALDMEPRVAQHAAYGLSAIATYVSIQNPKVIEPYYHTLLQKLMDCAEKTGIANDQLRENAADGLISVISCYIPNTEELLNEFASVVLFKCTELVNMQSGNKDQIYNLQRFYCISLVSLLQRLKNECRLNMDQVMNIAFSILNSDNTATHTQAILLYDAVINSIGIVSLNYITEFLPLIVHAICTPSDVSTCRCAINCLSDLLLIIGDTVSDPIQQQNYYSQIIAHRDELLTSIQSALSAVDIPRDIKPDLFDCLTSMYWELSDYCLIQMKSFLSLSLNAASIPVDTFEYEEDWEWADRLYCSVVEFWSSLSSAILRNREPILEAFPSMIQFVNLVVKNERSSNRLLKSTVMFLFDMGRGLGSECAQFILNNPACQALFIRCNQVGNECAEAASECQTVLQQTASKPY